MTYWDTETEALVTKISNRAKFYLSNNVNFCKKKHMVSTSKTDGSSHRQRAAGLRRDLQSSIYVAYETRQLITLD